MPRPQSVFLTPDLITDDDRFAHRANRTSSSHLDTLARTLSGKKSLDPIWVWREVDDSGNTTGNLVVMDGWYRLAAYEVCFRKSRNEHYLKIPAHIFEGSVVTAALKALALNSKDKLSLTHSEKLDAAWNIVAQDLKNEATKPMIASASGISERTVLTMRNKRNKIIEAGEHMPNSWSNARVWPKVNDWTPQTDVEREAEIEQLKNALQEAMRKTRSRDIEVVAEAIRRSLGHPRVTFVVDYLRGAEVEDFDEFDEDAGPMTSDAREFCLVGDRDF